jgi:hypothetical protein
MPDAGHWILDAGVMGVGIAIFADNGILDQYPVTSIV